MSGKGRKRGKPQTANRKPHAGVRSQPRQIREQAQ
jgi:hypothetical protein